MDSASCKTLLFADRFPFVYLTNDYNIDVFVIGDDWKGKFDFLKKEGAEVVYLERTPEISTTQIKSELQNK